ncbi:MAG: Stk1 family PASTA domain-containing Ser/Thr kinase, partial [Oscillospiraceae bacterium]|nr:Stk1 family PASTA domain-containing Ser/Thr kinase [Oscillospiraceae bacterium]
MDKYIGKKLDGRYEITELIGVGGMADVYKATDIIDNKEVAVKILKKEFSENEEFLRRFRNESKAIALLSHPNIVKIYDVGFSDKLQFIVMEYIDGITLKEYIDNEQVLTWKDSVHFIIQILRALQHAHDRGIVHRDIKPQNIMLLTDGTIKVMDFGIAKFARGDSSTQTDQAIGTVHYISPEAARGDETDEKSDIYSVGVMLYEMLTGKKPFDTDNPISIAVMHMQTTPERPRSINPDIPAGLEEIILRAMEKDAENRYQTASDMIRDIEAFKANNTISFGYYAEVASRKEQNAESAGDPPTQYFSSATAQQEAARLKQESYDEYDEDEDDEYYEDDEDEEEEEESHSLFIPVMTAVTIAFIVVAIFFVLWLVKGVINRDIHTTKYEMPDLVGMNYYEAKDTYTYLDIQIGETEYSEYERDIIFFQDINAGDAVSNGQTVSVNVSLGKNMAKVPDVDGLHYEYARKMIEQEGFVGDLKYELASDGTEASNVIRTEPANGEEAEAGSTVVIFVSKGIDTNEVEVGQYIGMKLDDATRLCEYYGLVVETKDEASLEEEGTVIAQSIEPEEMVEGGTTIVLTYSNGEDPSGVVSYTLQLPADIVEGRYSIDVIDEKGVTRQSSKFNAGYTRSAVVDIAGTGTEKMVVVLANDTTGQSAEIGVYNFDFANVTYTAVRENVAGAFETVKPQTTEAPTEAPTEA